MPLFSTAFDRLLRMRAVGVDQYPQQQIVARANTSCDDSWFQNRSLLHPQQVGQDTQNLPGRTGVCQVVCTTAWKLCKRPSALTKAARCFRERRNWQQDVTECPCWP